MSTLDPAKPSCSNAKGSNERPLNDDDCSTRAKPPKLKPQPSQSLPSPKPQPVAKASDDGHEQQRIHVAELTNHQALHARAVLADMLTSIDRLTKYRAKLQHGKPK